MFETRIDGPDYEIMNSNFEYDLTLVSIPVELQGKDYSVHITWYKNDKAISLYKDKYSLKLYDAEGPASGSYRAETILTFDGTEYTSSSNTITLQMGTEPRQIDAEVQGIDSVYLCNTGESVSLNPEVITNVNNPTITCSWYKGNELVGDSKVMSINGVTEEAQGDYLYQTTVSKRGAYIPVNRSVQFKIAVIKQIECKPIYIHDLEPARDRGFIQVGWWVIDEIIKANNDGFNWLENPYDTRFKYPCEIANLVGGFSKWQDLEIQESRNGYIIGREELIKPI